MPTFANKMTTIMNLFSVSAESTNFFDLWKTFFLAKPSISTNSKLEASQMFFLIKLCCKPKCLRSLVWCLIQGFEYVEICNGFYSMKIKSVSLESISTQYEISRSFDPTSIFLASSLFISQKRHGGLMTDQVLFH